MMQFPYMPFYMGAPPVQQKAHKHVSLKQMVKQRDALNEIIDAEIKKREEAKKKDKPEPRKPPSFSFLETVALIFGLGPITAIGYFILYSNYVAPLFQK